jgi:hypothetical protein
MTFEYVSKGSFEFSPVEEVTKIIKVYKSDRYYDTIKYESANLLMIWDVSLENMLKY